MISHAQKILILEHQANTCGLLPSAQEVSRRKERTAAERGVHSFGMRFTCIVRVLSPQSTIIVQVRVMRQSLTLPFLSADAGVPAGWPVLAARECQQPVWLG